MKDKNTKLTLKSLISLGSVIQTAHFVKKYAAFVGPIAINIFSKERADLVKNIQKDEKFAGKIIVKTFSKEVYIPIETELTL